MFTKIRYFLPFAVVITAFCGVIYVTVQQNYRQSANDPQIQITEDLLASLRAGKKPQEVVPQTEVNLAQSLSPFIIILDEGGKVATSTANLNGKTPTPPPGVLDFVRKVGFEWFTWEPQKGIREATVLYKYEHGFVLVGRSLQEVEKREDRLTMMVGAAWITTMLASLVAVFLFIPKSRKD